MVKLRVGVRERCTLRFQSSIVGKLSGLARALAVTAYPGLGSNPLEGTVRIVGALGPTFNVNALPVGVGEGIDWLPRTGRVWGTGWPKMEPKTPVSKLRP